MFSFFSKKTSRRRRLTVFLVSLFIVSQFTFVSSARAQIPVTITSDLPRSVEWIETGISEMVLAAGLGALVQGASYFMRKLAYDTAKYIASGGQGQSALIFQDGFTSYLGTTVGDAAATAIGEFGEPFGLNLCSFPDINLQLYMQIRLSRLYSDADPPQPTCTWQDLRDGWSPDEIHSRLRQMGEGLPQTPEELFSFSLRDTGTDFGIALGAIAQVDNITAQVREGNLLDRLEGGGFKPITDLISGDILTPSEVVRMEAESITSKHQGEFSSEHIASMYATEASQILPMAASVFINTLTSELLSQLLDDGLVPSRRGGSSGAANFYAGAIRSNREAAERAFSFLQVTTPTQLDTFDVAAEYAACPDNPGLNNCVMDTGLQRAVVQARSGDPVTIKQAIEQGFLHRDWELIPPDRQADNADVRRCYSTKYCYSNLQKLRKARILPLGFEIAARRSDIDQPWRLGEVVDNFENCSRDAQGNAVADAAHPYCHLIDPNWVIKAPEARCESNVIGPELASASSPVRQEECADISTCISIGEDGACEDYGYCTREKNVWNFPGDKCEEQFATCRTYVNSSDGSVVSYLSRSVDYGTCNADSVGCLAYSREKAGDSWVSSAATSETYQLSGRKQVMYYNQNIADYQCGTQDEGCSLFKNYDGDNVFLKAAPEHLGCYDTNTLTPEVDWPTNRAQLSVLLDNDACDSFAGVCLGEEVGCENYTPQDGGMTVPGIIGTNACSAQCVGYDTYRQLASSFEGPVDPLYIIPEIADECSAQYVGCSEFTNLDDVIGGGERLEYYSSIKHCEKPEGGNEKVFYTWEGSAAEGYVLQVHRLKQVDAVQRAVFGEVLVGYTDELNSFEVGSPSVADISRSVLLENYAVCNADEYLAEQNNEENNLDPDCREFYDDEGNLYYRLMEQTVTISDSCHRLRKTEANMYEDDEILVGSTCNSVGGVYEGGVCYRCYGGGTYESGGCIYQGIATESNSCPSRANGCRAFTGNIAATTYTPAEYDFEPFGVNENLAREGWSGGSIVAESVQVGGHSLSFSGSELNLTIPGIEMQNSNYQYELTFWARGAVQSLNIYFEQDGTPLESGKFTYDPVLQTESRVSINDTWQVNKLGPVRFTGDQDSDVQLVLSSDGNDDYFIDNFKLVRVQGTGYLIKDSWQTEEGYDVPLICDANPFDAFPGAALGCSAYRAESSNDTVYTSGFDSLCREEAVGCEPLIDTRNTNEPNMTAYNVWCEGPVGECTVRLGGDLADIGNVVGTCQVAVGQSGCYVGRVSISSSVESEFLASDYIVESTVIIPADSNPATPIFLANRPEYRCRDTALGCEKMAVEEKITPTDGDAIFNYNEIFVLNNPAIYENILCEDDQVGCGEFRSENRISFFKDPYVTGNSLCVYREGLGDESLAGSGWFLDGVGECDASGNLCRSDADCAGGDTCSGVGDLPCYPDYLQEGTSYGLWSNESDNYDGFVGVCPAEANLCTEFVDVVDTTSDPNGEAYYIIYDDNVKEDVGECSGQVSLREGCVLFDQTDNPRKLYDAAATYTRSEREVQRSGDVQQSMVEPISTAGADTNVILNVDRDRECAEWLACRNEVTYHDESGVAQKLCYAYAPCQETDGTRCTKFVDSGDDFDEHYLDQQVYISRDTTWYGWDYSGYSLFNRYPIGDYVYFGLNDDTPKTYVGYKMSRRFFTGFEGSGCPAPAGDQTYEDVNWGICGFDGGGRCVNGDCIYPIDGRFPDGIDQDSSKFEIASALEGGTCKAHPETDSPYPHGVLVSPDGFTDVSGDSGDRYLLGVNKQDFAGANVCQTWQDCSCEYNKITYDSGEVDYWPLSNGNDIPAGICIGGVKCEDLEISDLADCERRDARESMDGKPCDYSDDCGVGGTCSSQVSNEKRIGTLGYCLEKDYSRPINGGVDFACLTWLPIQVSASGVDIYNAAQTAGYDPSNDADGNYGQVYCQSSTRLGAGEFDDDLFRQDLIPLEAGASGVPVSAQYLGVYDENGEPRLGGFDDPYYLSQATSEADTRLEYTYTVTELWAKALGGNFTGNRLVLRFDNCKARTGSHGQCMTDDNGNYISLVPDTDFADRYHPPRFSGLGEYEGFVYFSPGGAYNIEGENSAGISDSMWRWSGEHTLLESDLKKVFFVPQAYYDGAEDRNPGIGTQKLSIDFNALRESDFYQISGVPRTDDGGESVGALEGSDDFRASGVSFVLESDSWSLTPYEPQSDSRDRVATRYSVLFYYVGSPSFALNPIMNSPYEATCNSEFENWLVLGMDFNEDGEFLGYVSRWCHGAGDSNGVKIAIVAEVNEHCAIAAQVYQDNVNPLFGQTNKAWTDKMYRTSEKPHGYSQIEKDSAQAPFGSMQLVGSDVANIRENPGDYLRLRQNTFDMADRGIPYSCRESWFSATMFSRLGRCDAFPGLTDSQKSTFLTKTTDQAELALDSIFAQVFNTAEFVAADGSYSISSGDDKAGTIAADLEEVVLPPQIFSLNPVTCANTVVGVNNAGNSGEHCTAGEKDNITINGVNSVAKDYNGDGFAEEDRNGNGVSDGVGLIGVGSHFVVARFFAFADHNRMPIRRIWLDWGDEATTLVDQRGLYENRKPYCSTNKECGIGEEGGDFGGIFVTDSTQLTCDTSEQCQETFGNDELVCADAGDHFGNQDRACEEGYFEFTHSYLCDANELGNPDIATAVRNVANLDVRDRLLRMGLGEDDLVCQFRPKVQVMDNWGWCNGDCIGGEGCYDGRISVDRYNECSSYETRPSWTNYRGQIVVIPN